MKDPRYSRGIELFNNEEFFECHEVLEEVWKDQSGVEKAITQSIIQVAVAYYHLGKQNPKGAVKLLSRAVERLRELKEQCPAALFPFIDTVENDLCSLKGPEGSWSGIPARVPLD